MTANTLRTAADKLIEATKAFDVDMAVSLFTQMR